MVKTKDRLFMNYENVIATGFQPLDGILGGGFHNGSLNIIAARPGMGKTTFAFQCAAGMAKNTEKKIYIQSLEMSSDYAKRRYPYLNDEKRIIIDDTAPTSMTGLCARLAKISDLGAVIIDYLQLIDPEDCVRKPDVISRIVFELKLLSKELGVPVICTSQLPRALERRRNRRPILRDLKNDVPEQDMDVFLFLFREGYYNRKADPSEAEIIVAKNRCGGCGVLPFYLDFGKKIHLEQGINKDE